MKIAILSDIHSNLTAFNAVIDELEKLNIKNIIIAGDILGDGPQPKEVIQKIRSLGCWVIKGNRDDNIIKYHKGVLGDWDKYKQMAAMVWNYRQIDDEGIKYIDELPESRSVNVFDSNLIRVVHGSPSDIYEHLYPDKYPERLEKALKDIDEDILICGHTHEQWTKGINGKLVVNPGSVGIHFNKEICAEYAILSKEEGIWKVEHRLVKYDINELEKSFLDSGLYEYSRAWVRLLLQSIKSGENKNSHFLKFAYDLAENEGYIDCKLVPNHIWDKAEKMWDWSC